MARTEIVRRRLLSKRVVLWGLIPGFIIASVLFLAALALPGGLALLPALGISVLALATLPMAAYRAFRRPGVGGRTLAATSLSVLVSTAVAYLVLTPAWWPLRRWAFERAAARAEPVIAAIQEFERVTGEPPASLSELVPTYLAGVPGTGLIPYPTFEYSRFDESGGSLLWWDLGSRQGAEMSGLWVYADGDPGHAILAIAINGSGFVSDARVDRMPVDLQQRPFDADAWHANPQDRMHMVWDLRAKHVLADFTREDLESLLGPPAGTRMLGDAPWELRIPCSAGFLNWDVLIYWPTERYPDAAYGGWIEPVGRWAYVHE